MKANRNTDKNQNSSLILTIKFNKTAMNILLPLLISTGVFIVELYYIYHTQGSYLDFTEFLHLANTCFVPTHIATSTSFLYDFYSSGRQEFFDADNKTAEMEVVKEDRAGFTVIATIIIGFVYTLCNVDVTFVSQILLMILQIAYMVYLYIYGVGSKIVEYHDRKIRNVLMSASP